MSKALFHSNWMLAIDSSSDSYVFKTILPEPRTNSKAQVKAAINEVVTKHRRLKQKMERTVIPWLTMDTTAVFETCLCPDLSLHLISSQSHFLVCFCMKGVISSLTVQQHALHSTIGQSTCCGIKMGGLLCIKYGSLLFTT